MKTTALVVLALVVLTSCQTTPPTDNALVQERDKLVAERDKLAGERDQLARDRDALLAKTGSLEGQLIDLERQLALRSTELDQATTRYNELKTDSAAAVAAGQATKSEIQKSLEKALGERQAAEARLASLQLERDALALQLKQETDRLDAAVAQLKQALKVEISAGNLEVLRYQNVLVVNIKDSLLFAADSPELRPDYKATLGIIAKAFQQFPDKVIRVEGHTAVAPSRWPTSWDLGAARAVSVVRYLQNEQGIDATRLVALSFGEYRPLAPNNDEATRAKNRRVELVLVDRPLYQVKELAQSAVK